MSETLVAGEFGSSDIATTGNVVQLNIPNGCISLQLWAIDGNDEGTPFSVFHEGTDDTAQDASAPIYPAGPVTIPCADKGGQGVSVLYVAAPAAASGTICWYASKVGDYP